MSADGLPALAILHLYVDTMPPSDEARSKPRSGADGFYDPVAHHDRGRHRNATPRID
jgi:hypothetical protein